MEKSKCTKILWRKGSKRRKKGNGIYVDNYSENEFKIE